MQSSGFGFQQPRVTATIKWLIVTFVAVYFLQMALEVWAGLPISQIFGFSAPLFVLKFYLWQPLTYMFLHGSLMHIVFNLLVFYMMGGDLESLWGRRNFLKYALITGLAGPLLQLLIWGAAGLINPEWMGSRLFVLPTIGASGIVYGILAAYGVLYGEAIIQVFFVIPMKMRVFIWALVLMELSLALFSREQDIAHIFHLGGMAAGYLMIRFKGPNLRGPGGGGGSRLFKSKMSRDEMKSRLKVVSNNPPKKEEGDRGLPITWN